MFVKESSILLLILFSVQVLSFTEPGKWTEQLSQDHSAILLPLGHPRSLFKNSQIFVQISCKSEDRDSEVSIQWSISETSCWGELEGLPKGNKTLVSISSSGIFKCNEHIILDEVMSPTEKPLLPENPQPPKDENKKHTRKKREDEKPAVNVKKDLNPLTNTKQHPLFTIPTDGLYFFTLSINSVKQFTADVHVEMIGTYGYLSAMNWPLLTFFGVMCVVYVIFGIAWLLVSFCQWKDLLRIQFWIGGVILLGMLEKATFYAEYYNINSSGVRVPGVEIFAEFVSCGKRTLARMLVIIVSIGFGIVKPRLGSMLHKVVGVGACYFVLSCFESYQRVKNRDQMLIASIPLALLDSAICWWIFTSLIQTTRTLRLRRNLVKLSLYRHFTNALIFSVISSVVFMLYSIKTHTFSSCLTDWKEVWVDDAYWHVLFSLLLLVIMVLWRPTNNNQRYAFTPLLDASEDEDDQYVSEAYGVKMRNASSNSRANSPKPKAPNSDDEALKWVEENIPSLGVETALNVLDSEEELVTTKMEVSKMQ